MAVDTHTDVKRGTHFTPSLTHTVFIILVAPININVLMELPTITKQYKDLFRNGLAIS